jgi:hypothetical protein
MRRRAAELPQSSAALGGKKLLLKVAYLRLKLVDGRFCHGSFAEKVPDVPEHWPAMPRSGKVLALGCQN